MILIRELVNKQKELDQEIKDIVGKKITPALKEFAEIMYEKIDGLEEISWTQYSIF